MSYFRWQMLNRRTILPVIFLLARKFFYTWIATEIGTFRYIQQLIHLNLTYNRMCLCVCFFFSHLAAVYSSIDRSHAYLTLSFAFIPLILIILIDLISIQNIALTHLTFINSKIIYNILNKINIFAAVKIEFDVCACMNCLYYVAYLFETKVLIVVRFCHKNKFEIIFGHYCHSIR